MAVLLRAEVNLAMQAFNLEPHTDPKCMTIDSNAASRST
jgi:hypothetical protein